MTRRLPTLSVVLFAALHFTGCGTTSAIDDLGTLGGESSMALGINQTGSVTGGSYKSSGDPHIGYHAFRYVDGLGMVDVGALPGGDVSEGHGINSSGVIAGAGLVVGSDSVSNAFLASPQGVLSDIGTVDVFSFARDINDKGQVTGESSNSLGNDHAFLWTQSDGMTDLGTLGGSTSVGRSINENGQISGESKSSNDSATRAFRFTPGVGMVDLGTLGGRNSSAFGINDSGQVVGESDTGFNNGNNYLFLGLSILGTHAFLWTEGVGIIDLGHFPGGHSTAHAINNRGIVVGSSSLKDGSNHAFMWTKSGGMVDLNGLLPRGSGWVLYDAWDINDNSQIVGNGLHNGKAHAYRLNYQAPTLAP